MIATPSVFPTPPASATVRPRILLVDDDEVLRSHYALLLERAGLHVTQTANSERAWEWLVARLYHLVIIDHARGGDSAPVLVQRMRDAHVDVPVIVMSGTRSPDCVHNDHRERVEVVMAKPFTLYQFLMRVDMALHPDSRTPATETVRIDRFRS